MEKCFSSYQVMAPHHDLARYCIKASCPHNHHADVHQVDCFTACSKHVSSKVSKTDWQEWAKALAGSCQGEPEGEDQKNSFDHKFICADKKVWTHLTTSQGMSQTDTMATHCYSTICQENIKCGTEAIFILSLERKLSASTLKSL